MRELSEWLSGNYITVFTLIRCERSNNLVAFRVSGDNTVEVMKYKRGKCPWIRYNGDGSREAR
jgi:hypothetical protein